MRKLRYYGLMLLFSMFLTLQAAAATDPAAQAVSKLQETALTVQKILQEDNGKNTEAVRQKAQDYAEPFFDFQRMTALAVGRGWREANNDQKKAIIKAFTHKLTAIYSGIMLQFKDAKVVIYGKDRALVRRDGREVVVYSEVIPVGGAPVQIQYTMYLTDNAYRIYDIHVEGQSIITVYRPEYTKIINQSGIEGLIEYLQNDGQN